MKADTPKYTEHRRLREERQGTLLGVEGRWSPLDIFPTTAVGTFHRQKFTSHQRTKVVDGQKLIVVAEVRFDDKCKNGQNSLAITGHGWEGHVKPHDWDFGGCIHEIIAQVFPELAHLIQWHLFDTRGPMHYIANTIYHASDCDHNGLRKGEKLQILAGGKTPLWDLVMDATGCKLRTKLEEGDDITCLPLYRLETMLSADEMPTVVPRLYWQPLWRHGEGKDRDLDAARRCANWPEATDEQLCLPEPELRALLEARLPKLLADFRRDIEAAGFYWSPEDMS